MATAAINIAAGDAASLAAVCMRGDGVTPVDLTTATLIFTVALLGTTTPIFTKTTPTQIVLTDAVNGKATVQILPADTRALVGPYAFDLVLLEANGNRSTLVSGSFTVSEHPNRG